MMADFYSVLGVVKDASEDEIKKVYKMLVRKWHPDKNRDNQKEATIKMQQICEAYLILGDGEKRTYYDMKMMFGEDEKNDSCNDSHESYESYESDEATADEDVEEDETGYESSKSKMMLSRRDQMMKKKSKILKTMIKQTTKRWETTITTTVKWDVRLKKGIILWMTEKFQYTQSVILMRKITQTMILKIMKKVKERMRMKMIMTTLTIFWGLHQMKKVNIIWMR